MKRNKFLALLVVLVLIFAAAGISYSAVATQTTSWSNSDVTEINGYSPSAQKTFLGQRLLGLFKNETSTITTVGSKDLDLDDRVILFTTQGLSDGGTNDATYANGEPGQEVTFVLVTDGGANVIITPVTATGFTSVEMDSAGDTCGLKYQDDTVGWVVNGSNSCTVNQ